jgi:hypothetical protein
MIKQNQEKMSFFFCEVLITSDANIWVSFSSSPLQLDCHTTVNNIQPFDFSTRSSKRGHQTFVLAYFEHSAAQVVG